ncbi:MAG: TrkA family potassium uptake protein [Candidatus Dependentiae bacterium]|nr:TrkA family potassium uptake protein [Candidatus Dependentiae bacterium]
MKFCVIGLGRFGYQVATGLAEHGIEVLAIDSQENLVASIKDHVTHAICMRVTDEASLRSVGIDEMDTVIVATGENFAESVLITALLKKRLKMPKVIARAINDIHQDILKLVGADEIVLPEREIGNRLADKLSSPFIDTIHLAENFSVSQLRAPKKFVGKKLSELDIYKNYHVHCIGIKHDANTVVSIDPEDIIGEQDLLMFSGNDENLEKMAKL